jgi:hypothetical protein
MKISESNSIHERIDTLVRHFCKGNKTAFGRETDILPGVLASITGGRLSKPSFELLQKIMTRYPAVNGDWLILGREPMLKNNVIDVTHEPASAKSGLDDFIEASRRIEELQTMLVSLADTVETGLSNQLRQNAESAEEIAGKKVRSKVYFVGGEAQIDAEDLLSTRLGITEEEAEKIAISDKIRAYHLDNKYGFRVSEQAVLEYLSKNK